MKRMVILIFVLTLLFTTLPIVQAASSDSASLSGVQIFPKDHIWNVPINNLPVDSRSTDYINTIDHNSVLSGYMGFPYNVVNATQTKQFLTSFTDAWASDNVPYPIPANPLIEPGGSDRHMLILDRDSNILYELFGANQAISGTWSAVSGVVWNLSDYKLRPDGWGSADAAGMAMLPGLLRYDEVNSGNITHALRFGLGTTQNAHVWPATSNAGIADLRYTPMGQRFRLKASFDTSGYSPQMKTILEALKKYGMMVADNSGSQGQMVICVVPDSRWTYDTISPLNQVKASDFEAVNVTSLMISKNSGQARITPIVTPIPTLTPKPTPPIAKFTANITQGMAPLTVQFTDQSVSAGATTYKWDVTNDGGVDYTIKNPVHTYQTAGNFTVSLNVTNALGSDTVMHYINVTIMTYKIGIYQNGVWYLDYNGNGAWNGAAIDKNYNFVGPANVLVAGDWNGDSKTEIGVTNDVDWYLDMNGNGTWDGPTIDKHGYFGISGYKPVVGDWNGDGKTEIGVTNGDDGYLDSNGNGTWDGPTVDKHEYFGIIG